MKRGVRLHQGTTTPPKLVKNYSPKYWSKVQNQREHFDRIAKECNIHKTEHWFPLKESFVSEKLSYPVLQRRYKNCLYLALSSIYPQFEWKAWNFAGNLPHMYWCNKENQQEYFQYLAAELGIETYDDWYRVQLSDIKESAGRKFILNRYGGSVAEALRILYPECEWLCWRFYSVPDGFWANTANHRKYFDWVSEQLQLKDPKDWIHVSHQNIVDTGGSGLLSGYYGNSLFKALESVYPEHFGKPWNTKSQADCWSDFQNRKRYFDWLELKLGIDHKEQWYALTASVIEYHQLAKYYDYLLSNALKSVYPEHNWLVWKFVDEKESRHFWKSTENHRIYFDWLKEELKLQSMDDWYKITEAQVIQNGGSVLLSNYYSNSLSKALISIYPEHNWQFFKFTSQNSSVLWNDKKTFRQLFDQLSEQLNIDKSDDWYRVRESDVIEKSGSYLFHRELPSLYYALSSVYPEFLWQPWRFIHSIPRGFWNDKTNQRAYFDWLAEEMNITHYEQWYDVNIYESKGKFVSIVMRNYDNSLSKALTALYPEYPWHTWRFTNLSVGYWEDIKNQRSYFDWLASQLGIESPEDWYDVSKEDLLSKYKISWLDRLYHDSLGKALMTIYPEYNWQPWRFSTSPMGFWNDPQNHKIYFDWLIEQLNIKTADDWYRVTWDDFRAFKGLTFLYKNGGLGRVIEKYYPNASLTFTPTQTKIQNKLVAVLKEVFPTATEINSTM